MMNESVTVTVQNGNEAGRPVGGPGGTIIMNVPYFQTQPGLCKLAQLVLGIFCIVFGSAAWPTNASGWFVAVAILFFIMSVVWALCYLFSVRESGLLRINWPLTELINFGFFAIVYLAVSISELSSGLTYGAAHVLAGIFGLLNTAAYAGTAYYGYLEHMSGQ